MITEDSEIPEVKNTRIQELKDVVRLDQIFNLCQPFAALLLGYLRISGGRSHRNKARTTELCFTSATPHLALNPFNLNTMVNLSPVHTLILIEAIPSIHRSENNSLAIEKHIHMACLFRSRWWTCNNVLAVFHKDQLHSLVFPLHCVTRGEKATIDRPTLK